MIVTKVHFCHLTEESQLMHSVMAYNLLYSSSVP